jgi:hypothetical protein
LTATPLKDLVVNMIGLTFSSVLMQGAIREMGLLAAAALARALDEPAELPSQLPHLTALLLPERQAPPAILRRGAQMNKAMLFSVFEPVSPFQHRVLASGLRVGFAERVLTRLQQRPAKVPPSWIESSLRTALAGPAFQAQAQGIVYRGLRRRRFFGPGGLPNEPLSVATFLALIVWSGRPNGLPPEAWKHLEDIVRTQAGTPDFAGHMDRLVLAEARETFGLAGADEGQEKNRGIEYVSG